MPDRPKLPDTERPAMGACKFGELVVPRLARLFDIDRLPDLIGVSSGVDHQEQVRARPVEEHKSKLSLKRETSGLLCHKGAALGALLFCDRRVGRIDIVPLEVGLRQPQILPCRYHLLIVEVALWDNIAILL